jgi:hypothetical protein
LTDRCSGYFLLNNPRVTSAWLHSEPFQSGLGDAEYNLLREQLRHAVNPTSSGMIKTLSAALDELRGGVVAMRRMVMQRTGLEEYSDGTIRAGSLIGA